MTFQGLIDKFNFNLIRRVESWNAFSGWTLKILVDNK